MLAIALYILVAALLGLLLLPVIIDVQVRRPAPAAAPALGLRVAVALGALGAHASGWGRQWRVRPVLLGLAMPYPSIALGTRAPAAPGEPRPSGTGPGPRPRPGPERPAEGIGGLPGARRLLDLMGWPALRLAAGLPRVLRLRRCCVSGRYGFADPARTGQVCGALEALRARRWRRVRLELEPSWTEAGISGQGEVRLHFHLGLLLYLMARFAASVSWRWAVGRLASTGWVPGTAH
ncbi:MAG: hypothetical protein ABIL09_00505 [Gemmatimonadota bacterium]